MPHPATRWLHCGLPERSAKDVKSAMDPNPQVVKAAPGCFVRMASDNLRRNCIAAAVLVVAILAAVNGTFLRADRGDRDWDNRRLILPVPSDWRRPVSAAPAHYEGSFDHAGCDMIAGWAWNASVPNAQVKIRILDDGKPLMTLTADRPRPDLSVAGKGNGAHAFFFDVPAALKDGRSHSIVATTDAAA